jgi:NTP pyrophosphatase (non-canonical NTP hydrolase)
MENKTYSEFVNNLVKPGEEILSKLTPNEVNVIHMALGISGEAGEILDAVKKATIYRKPLDMENLIEELGDIEFYLEGLRQAIGVDRFTVLDLNVKKLSKRYGSSYSDKSAIERKDKQS